MTPRGDKGQNGVRDSLHLTFGTQIVLDYEMQFYDVRKPPQRWKNKTTPRNYPSARYEIKQYILSARNEIKRYPPSAKNEIQRYLPYAGNEIKRYLTNAGTEVKLNLLEMR